MKVLVRFFSLTAVLFIGISPMTSLGQGLQREQITRWHKEINKILLKEKSSYVFKDSIAMYAFDFKLKIVKTKDNGGKLKQLFVSDSLLYELFPNYQAFYNVDFSALLRKRNEVNVVIPILVYSVSPTGQSRYQRQDGQPLVSVESAMEITEKSFTSILSKNNFEEVVLLTPVVIKIINLVD